MYSYAGASAKPRVLGHRFVVFVVLDIGSVGHAVGKPSGCDAVRRHFHSAVARFAGPTVGRMAANQTWAEQQLIRDEHCLMRNE